MQIVAKVRAAYRIDFTLRNFFEAPTIAQLSSAIEKEIISEKESLSESEARQITSENQGSLIVRTLVSVTTRPVERRAFSKVLCAGTHQIYIGRSIENGHKPANRS